MLGDLLPPLRDAVERLERLGPLPPDSPLAELRLATSLHALAGLLGAIARELETRAHDDLGRFGAQVVEIAARSRDPEAAASEVANAFLQLSRVS
jgi:hypothetical protein